MRLRSEAPARSGRRTAGRAAVVNHAVACCEAGQVTAGRAAHMAGMPRQAFEALLTRRKVWLHYDEADLQSDLATLRGLFSR
ncbi:MAG TPA: UPF0175 family protein [Longimicrobium sp.]|jgi:predicted HTH domain antitoxin|uniref:UPF0175 family protein n=1 Tax=Longimicrobium sp. TaxID=2029185 RepID=UPI002EDB3E8B